jgi:acyl-CoA synthetase (AMP-forming)/AMP-acid ligase II
VGPGVGLHERLERLAREAPAAAAIIAPGREALDRRSLIRQVRLVSAALRRAGVRRGDIVVLALPDSPTSAIAFIGVSAVAAAAPLNPAYRPAEFEFYFRGLAPAGVVVATGADSAAGEVARSMGVRVWELDTDPSGVPGDFRFADGGDDGGRADGGDGDPAPPDHDDVALVLHTSGTTALPKRVPLTHRNLAAGIDQVAASLGLVASDRCLHVLPMFHVGGLVDNLAAPLATGGAIIGARGYSVDAFYDGLDRCAPTWTQLAPPMLAEVLDHADRRPEIVGRRTLRFVRSVSAPLAPPLLERFERRFGVPVVEIYGMTETTGVITSNPIPDGERKPGSVGVPVGPRIEIVDGEGRALPRGAVGEVRVAGDSVMRGYADAGDPPGLGLTDGWLATGDAGYFDADGYLYLVGRFKEMINRGGEKVLPREIDDAIAAHPAVVDAAAFGVPHPTLGESVALAVVPRPGATIDRAGITAYLSRRLAHFKVPRAIHIVGSIPRSASGKVQRHRLAQRLGAHDAVAAVRPAYVAPATPAASAIVRLWREVLGIDRIGADDDFFALGGDSLKAAGFLSRFEAAYGASLPVSAIFDAPTPAGFCAWLSRAHPQIEARLDDASVAPATAPRERFEL